MRAGEAPAGHHPTTFRFTSATFAHPEVNADARAGLALDGPALESALERVRDAGIDAFVMNTCLRVEVAASGCERALGRVLELLFPDQELPAERVVRFDQEAVHHLYRVAAGLDSPIVGEPEVLGQFRAALDASRSSRVVGGLFEKALQSAIANGKALRRRMPHVGTGSVAVAAADIAAGSERVAIFGAGAMARAAAEALQRKPDAPEITVYARRPDAVSFPVDHVRDIGEAPRALAEMPAVISATAAKHELFGSAVLAESLGRRNDELLLIDLAMPPDFRPDDSTGHLCYLCVDDVAARARAVSAASSVEPAAEQAAGEAWAKLSNHHLVGPVIAAILAEADRAVSEEVSRFAGRLNGETDVLQQLAQTVAHRVLHRPLSFLGSSEHGADAAPVLAEVFGVDGDD